MSRTRSDERPTTLILTGHCCTCETCEPHWPVGEHLCRTHAQAAFPEWDWERILAVYGGPA